MKTISIINLAPCPFCGGNAAIARETYVPTRTIKTKFEGDFTGALPRVNDGWLMECETCGARGPHEYKKPIQTAEQARTAWNQRVQI
jgi:Lar family restriction alleviation protein